MTLNPSSNPTPAGDTAHDEAIKQAITELGFEGPIDQADAVELRVQLAARGLAIVPTDGTAANLDEIAARVIDFLRHSREDDGENAIAVARIVRVNVSAAHASGREQALREAAEVARKKWPRGSAHTYASENADRYIALEDASEAIAAAILNLITTTKEKVGE